MRRSSFRLAACWLSGWSLTYTPSRSFSVASISPRSYSGTSERRWRGRSGPSRRPILRTDPLPGPRIAQRTRHLATSVSAASTMARRFGCRSCRAPTLARHSNAARLNPAAWDGARYEVASDRNSPFWLRSSTMPSTNARPQFLMADRPNRIPLPSFDIVKSAWSG